MIKSLYPQFQRWSATGSIYLISDTHFDDDCKIMNPNWINPKEHMKRIKRDVQKSDTLIHLGDVGNPTYLDELKCYKVLISGNHDILSKVADHFDEIYTGPLFIADRILLSHEPIYGLEEFTLNIHGHIHNGPTATYYDIGGKYRTSHLNLASDVAQWYPCNLRTVIEAGYLSEIPNYHRVTIDKAIERKEQREEYSRYFGKDFAFKLDKIINEPYNSSVPAPCINCANHPSNGGNGICHCTLASPIITC